MTVSHLTTSQFDLADEILNELTGGSFSHLTMSQAEIYARIYNNLTGSSISHLTTSQATIRSGILTALASDDISFSPLTYGRAAELASILNALVDGGGGGGAAPEWVPENAKIYIDLVGGSPQGRAWVFGVGEVDVDTLLGTDANTENGWGPTDYDPENLSADGYLDEVANLGVIGAARTALVDSATVCVQFKGFQDSTSVTPLVLVSADGAAALFLEFKADRSVKASSNDGEISSISNITNALPDPDTTSINALAATLTATRLDIAANGSDAVAGVLTADDRPPGSPLVAALVDIKIAHIQSITLYDALPSTAGLPALSETGVTNTAPHDIVSTWDFGGVEGEVPDDNVEAANVLWSDVSATDDEGNPLTYSVAGDVRVTFDAGTILFDASGGLTAGDINFTLRATDPGGLFVEQEFTITVTVLIGASEFLIIF